MQNVSHALQDAMAREHDSAGSALAQRAGSIAAHERGPMKSQGNPMNTLTRKFFAASIATACAIAPALARADKVARVVADYTVFVDPPTGFVFVKLPQGWKFVGNEGAHEVTRVPGSVVTSMLVGTDESVANRAASAPVRRLEQAMSHTTPAR
jgi:hypothetical protein